MRFLLASTAYICLLSNTAFCFDDAKADKAKVTTEDVKVRDLTLKVPSTWKKEPNSSNMRLATYSTPPAKGDTDRGELTVFSFPGGGGDVGPNITRWIGQFSGKGKTAKVTKGMTAGDSVYYFVNITGTFNKSVGPPIMRKTEPVDDYRMLGVILTLKGKGVYYLKLTGPKASIKAQAQLLRQSFGGNAKTETDYEL